MTDWVARIADRFIPGAARLYIAADPDRLLGTPEVADELDRRGFVQATYGDPIEFRYQYEDQLRALVEGHTGAGVVVNVDGLGRNTIPFDMLAGGRFVSVGFADIVPRLHPVALSDVPREHVG